MQARDVIKTQVAEARLQIKDAVEALTIAHRQLVTAGMNPVAEELDQILLKLNEFSGKVDWWIKYAREIMRMTKE